MKQLGLFGETAPAALPGLEADRALDARLPPHVLLGPSTWTFPGWQGIVYPEGVGKEELLERGLAMAARHPLFRTVGVDRSYYAPLGEEELLRYREALPARFPCVMKAWSAITTLVDPRTGTANPRFLDAGALEQHVLRPLARAFHEHLGALVLQLAPIPPAELPHPERFAELLDRFLGVLPTAFPYAVEIRNRELYTPSYLSVLARHGVAHVLSLWERMPTVGRQLALPGALTAPFVVSRLSIAPGHRYDDRKRDFSPFDRLVEVDEEMRADVARLAESCAVPRRTLFVVVNNKVEGSSPLTVRALIQRICRCL